MARAPASSEERGVVMLEYRFFFMRPDGSIKEAETRQMADDISALEEARLMRNSNGIEGWQAARLVFRLGPDGESA
jgi:hypothetical protein